MAGISRVHGGVTSESLHGGYQTTYLLIKDTGNSPFTADTQATNADGSLAAIVEGGFSKSIRAIQTVATTVFIGPQSDNGFLVGLDGATAQPTGPAYNSDTTPTVAERIKDVVEAIGGTVTATVTVKTLTLANFA
jgi:hypothetical protein